MPPRSTLSKVERTSTKHGRHGPSKLSQISTLSPPRKKMRPMTPLGNVPVFDLTQEDVPPPKLSQGHKGKEKLHPPPMVIDLTASAAPSSDTNLPWASLFAPNSIDGVAVHARKVEDVRRWMTEALFGETKIKKYRRILALNGPAGAGKSTLVRLLAEELSVDVLEWHTPITSSSSTQSFPDSGFSSRSDTLTSQFVSFIARASSCSNVFSPGSSKTSASGTRRGRLLLLEDIPNVLHPQVQEQAHVAFQDLVDSSVDEACPCIIIVSDAGLRGEDDDGSSNTRDSRDVIGIRDILPKTLLHGPFVTNIKFNPIASTIMRKALQTIIDTASAGDPMIGKPPKGVIDAVVESSRGDIRCATNLLEFASRRHFKSGKLGKEKISRPMLEVITQKENNLVLFHLLGKVLYNKRKGDPPAPKATNADIKRDQALDSRLPDPPELPPYLSMHQRRTPRDDVETLYGESPVDSSLFSLYIQQNYPPYCDSIDECAGVSDWLSWVDANGTESWMQANPHRFSLVARATMYSLPSPVQRRGQKQFKPAFFESLNKERAAADAIRDAQMHFSRSDNATSFTYYSSSFLVLDLPTVLKLRRDPIDLPSNHVLFSQFDFGRDGGSGAELGEDSEDLDDEPLTSSVTKYVEDEQDELGGGWLEDDTIEDV